MKRLTLRINYEDGAHDILVQYFEREWVLDHALAELSLFDGIHVIAVDEIEPITVNVAGHAQDVLVELQKTVHAHYELSDAA